MRRDYHPLDVRYKGPSTAYRGPKRLRETGQSISPLPPATSRRAQKDASGHAEKPPAPQPSPWGSVIPGRGARNTLAASPLPGRSIWSRLWSILPGFLTRPVLQLLAVLAFYLIFYGFTLFSGGATSLTTMNF